jgi:hypothetical protein
MFEYSIIADAVYCSGWIAIGAAMLYVRYRKEICEPENQGHTQQVESNEGTAPPRFSVRNPARIAHARIAVTDDTAESLSRLATAVNHDATVGPCAVGDQDHAEPGLTAQSELSEAFTSPRTSPR